MRRGVTLQVLRNRAQRFVAINTAVALQAAAPSSSSADGLYINHEHRT